MTAMAMVLDRPVEGLMEVLGHDGSEVLWPDLPEPIRRRGHHIEELQYLAYYTGNLLVPFVPGFEYNPGARDDLPFAKYDFSGRFQVMLKRYDGILLGEYKRGTPHAVAWNAREGAIYDPDGFIPKNHDDFNVEAFYARIVGVG